MIRRIIAVLVVAANLFVAVPAAQASDLPTVFTLGEGGVGDSQHSTYTRFTPNGNGGYSSDITCSNLETGGCSQETLTSLRANVWAQVELPYCETASQDFCIESVKIYQDGQTPEDATFQYEAFPNWAKPAPAPEYGITSIGQPLVFKSAGVKSKEGSDLFLVQAGLHYNIDPQLNFVPSISEMKLSVFPVNISRNDDWAFAQTFEADTRVSVTLRAPKGVGGWFKGRMANVSAAIEDFDATDYKLTVDAQIVQLPVAKMSLNIDQLNELKAAHPDRWNFLKAGIESGAEGDGLFSYLDDMRPYTADTNFAVSTAWYLVSFSGNDYDSCNAGQTGLVGLVTTNATTYTGRPPTMIDTKMQFQVGGFHYAPDGTSIAYGIYDLLIKDPVARCIYGLPAEGDLVGTTEVTDDGTANPATTKFEVVNGFAHFSATGFHYSSPLIKTSLSSTAKYFSTSGKLSAGGTAKVGKTLKAVVGKITGSPAATYQWLRNGKKISGATKQSYKVTSKDKNTLLSVTVTLKASGYVKAIKTLKWSKTK